MGSSSSCLVSYAACAPFSFRWDGADCKPDRVRKRGIREGASHSRAAIEESSLWPLQRLPRLWHCIRLLHRHHSWPFVLPLVRRAMRPARWNECCSMRAAHLGLQFPVLCEGVHCSSFCQLQDIVSRKRWWVLAAWAGAFVLLDISGISVQTSRRKTVTSPTPPTS